jgi:hypothetical protein
MRTRLLASLAVLTLSAFLSQARRDRSTDRMSRLASGTDQALFEAPPPSSPSAADRDAARQALARLAQPITAAGAGGKLVLRDGSFTAAFTPQGISLSAVDRARRAGWTVNWSVAGARPVTPVPEGELEVRIHSIVGDLSTWKVNQAGYARTRYAGIHDGVDLVVESRPRGLEYSFEVAPGGDASRLQMKVEGATAVRVSEHGDAVEMTTGLGVLRESGLHAYQDGPDGRREIAARYRADGAAGYAIEVGEYDRTKPLVVDPLVSWSTYVGGAFASDPWRAYDDGRAIAVDALGNIYIAGQTEAKDIATAGAFQSTAADMNVNCYVAKLRGDGTGVVWATYLGSAVPMGLAVDSGKNVYLTGWTSLSNFPIVGGFQSQPGGAETGVVAKLAPDGASLIWSSYLGGNSIDHPNAIALDGANNVYVAGESYSFTFPVVNGIDHGFDFRGQTFVTKIAGNGASILSSSRIGGGDYDSARGIALDSSQNVYVTGVTQSTNFPVTSGSLSSIFSGGTDAFVYKINAAGTSLGWSTYFGGGSIDEGKAIAVDSQGNVYVGGSTQSFDFPVKSGFQMTPSGGSDAFVAKIQGNGSRTIWCSYLGGDATDVLMGLALDSSRNVIVAGWTSSYTFPTPGGFVTQKSSIDGGFVTKIRSTGNSLLWSSYTGGHTTDIAWGVAVDGAGNVLVVGQTGSASLIATPNGFDQSLGGAGDAYVLKVAPGGSLLWGSYYGGQYTDGYEELRGAAVDAAGNVYLTGNTNSVDFPATTGAFDLTYSTGSPPPVTYDAFVTKLSSTGALVWSTYLGGSNNDIGRAIAVDSLQNVYVTGVTQSTEFPVTPGSLRTTTNGSDMFVTKLNASGSILIWSTFLGGSIGGDTPEAIAVDSARNVVVVGESGSGNFPMAGNGYDPTFNGFTDGFVAKVAAAGNSLVWSTYLGGNYFDGIRAVALDASDNVYVAGDTLSANFPVNGFDPTQNGNLDAFVARIQANGRKLTWATYLGGGADDTARAVAVNPAGEVFVAGRTSSFDFPVTAGSFGGSYHGGQTDGFVARVSSSGSVLLWSSCVGGDGIDEVGGLVLDSAGNPIVAGTTASSNFPLVGAFNSTRGGFSDAFVLKAAAAGTSITFSSLYGGNNEDQGRTLGIDGSGRLYLGGITQSSDLAPGSLLDPSLGGIFDAFVTRIDQ